jgi:hypothetical protein
MDDPAATPHPTRDPAARQQGFICFDASMMTMVAKVNNRFMSWLLHSGANGSQAKRIPSHNGRVYNS